MSKSSTHFLTARDWWTFVLTTLGSFSVYYHGLPPSVTLEDAGELVVAADYLGVPHPPGYPIWTFLAWGFQWVFHGVEYSGYPNPAWPVALMSAVFGALACGIIGMLISKSTRMLVSNLRPGVSSFTREKTGWIAGVGIGLLICIFFHALPVLGWGVLGCFLTTLILISIVKGFKPESELSGLVAWLPNPVYMGAAFYGSVISFVGYLLAWNGSTIATLLNVLPMAILYTAGIVLLILALDYALGRVSRIENRDEVILASRLDICVGVGSGLLLAFSPLMWSQAQIVEVYSLNAFFMAIIMLLTFWYLCVPSPRLLMVVGFLFALGLTNHQSLLFLVFFLVAAIAAAKERTLFGNALKLILIGGIVLLGMRINEYAGDQGAIRVFSLGILYVGILLTLLIIYSKTWTWKSWKQLILLALLGVLGLGFHAFMPIASEQNAPMNWGYARTMKGFKHALGRGQYARFELKDNLQRISQGMQKPAPEIKEGTTEEREAEILEAHRLQRTMFMRQIAVFFTGTKGIDSLYDKYSIANLFSIQISKGELDPTGATPPPEERNIPLAILGILPLLVFARFGDKSRYWFHCCVIGMFFLTIVFMVIQWPQLNHNDLFVKRVQYIQAHALFSVWMGYGLAIVLLILYSFLRNTKILAIACGLTCLIFAWFPLQKNANDPRHIEYLGTSSLNGHDFGWQFGFYQLKGANGIIIDELSHHKNPDCKLTDWSIKYLQERGFTQEQIAQAQALAGTEAMGRKAFRKKVVKNVEGLDSVRERQLEHAGLLGAYRLLSKEEQAANLKFLHAPLPNLDYPPEMDQDAVFFGGTDPGRFVPTYMIYSADCRPDVFLITQNALADPTYLDTMRDLYGDDIWIPGALDSNRGFQEYGDDLRVYSPDKFANMMGPGGRVQVSGVNEVMQINFKLARNIFDQNKFRHSFYVEESYVIPWMDDYLRPHGLILHVEEEPYQLTEEDIKNDFEFWDWYIVKLLETYEPEEKRDLRFRRDLVARKTFSKLRGAIAGLYHKKGHIERAERAYQQSLELYPASPEATFRLADFYMKTRRFDDAEQVVENYRQFDPTNAQIPQFKRGVRQLRDSDAKRAQLAAAMKARPSLNAAVGLVQYQAMLSMDEEMRANARRVINSPNAPENALYIVAETMRQKKEDSLYEEALEALIRNNPKNLVAVLDLASLKLSQEEYQKSLNLLGVAVRNGGNTARSAIVKDPRLAEMLQFPAAQRLLTPPKTQRPTQRLPGVPAQNNNGSGPNFQFPGR